MDVLAPSLCSMTIHLHSRGIINHTVQAVALSLVVTVHVQAGGDMFLLGQICDYYTGGGGGGGH